MLYNVFYNKLVSVSKCFSEFCHLGDKTKSHGDSLDV